jgi:hypothetical protein
LPRRGGRSIRHVAKAYFHRVSFHVAVLRLPGAPCRPKRNGRRVAPTTKPRAGDGQRAVEVRLSRLTVEGVSRRNMPANGCAAVKEGHRDVLAARCASGLTSSPRVFQPEPQNVGLDGADRHGHAIVGELSVLRLVGHEALEDFPFYEDARRKTAPALPRAPILRRRISGRVRLKSQRIASCGARVIVCRGNAKRPDDR